MVKKALVACGSSIATATIIAQKLKELCKSNGIEINVIQASFRDIDSKIVSHKPDLILVSGAGAEGLNVDIPTYSGLPYLTGLGSAELDKQILVVLLN